MIPYEMMPASLISVFIVTASILVTPIYILATYVFSGASAKTGFRLGIGFLLFGSVMFIICLTNLPGRLGLAGNLIVPLCWVVPSLLLFIFRKQLLDQPLSQHWLVSLQLFRAIGAVFLIEMIIGNQPGIFAYPAGIGDILVALSALFILIKFRNATSISPKALIFLLLFGIFDFLSAFFFGFTSSQTPLQLFHPPVPNQIILFPTGMIPLFLVPYAIFFHTLSYLNLKMHRGES